MVIFLIFKLILIIINLIFSFLRTGDADPNEERLKKVNLHEIFKHLMLIDDQRFAKDARFPYFASNIWLRKSALEKGRLFVQKHSELANLTAHELQARILENQSLYRKVLSFGSSIKSTPPFYYTMCQG